MKVPPVKDFVCHDCKRGINKGYLVRVNGDILTVCKDCAKKRTDKGTKI